MRTDSRSRTRIRILIAAVAVGFAVLPAASASADRAYSLRYGSVERGDITMAANTIVSCPEGAANCASGRQGTGSVVRNSAWVMVPVDVDGDPSTFDSSSSDLRLPAGATILYAGLYWGSDTQAMPEGADAPNPSARGTVRLAAPDGAGYRTINASTVDSDRFYTSRYQGFADVTSVVRSAGAGTYTLANVQASTGKDQYGGWSLVVAYSLPSKPVRWLGLYDGFREFSGGDPADVSFAGFKTPASGTVHADFGMVSYEGDLGVSPDSARLNGLDLVDALHDSGNYWNARITEYGSYVTTKNPNYPNELGMDANIIHADGFIPNNASSAMLHMEVSTDLVMPGAMTLVSDQAATAPSNTAAPVISGTARDGQTLTTSNGTWTGTTPMTFAYQWQRCNSSGAACADVGGATSSTYALGSADVGSTMRVRVTASNVVGPAGATSAQTAAVTVRPPANTAAPTISGTARDGQTLTAANGTWTGTSIAYSYRWMRCDSSGANCAAIANATGSTYVLVSADVGRTIRVEVTGTNSGGNAVATSSQTAVVAARAPANTAAPAISGTARDGQTLSATDGTWSGTPTVTFTRQWQRCDSGGANCLGVGTASTYTLGGADVGSTIRVVVTGTNGAGNSSATSDPTAVVAAAPPANSGAPTTSGTARDGQTLDSTNGTWSGTATIGFTRRWLRCDSSGGTCSAISGATGQSYTLVPADVGSTIRVEVTGTNGGGSSAALSGPTAVVAANPPANSTPPTITGTARDGQTLTASNGIWSGTPTVTFSRQWQRCDSAGAGCAPIANATGSTYVLTPADVDRTIRVDVTGTNGGGSSTVTSGQTALVSARPPANTAAPAISGTARDGQTLTAGDGTWTGTPTIAFSRQWQRCDSAGNGCVDVSSAAGYTLTEADVDSTIRVRVTGTNGGGSSSATSAQTAVVAAAGPANTSAPSVSGTARDGQTLSATDGSWSGTPTITFTRRWMRCDSAGSTCGAISGATGTSYVLTPSDVGKTIRVEVTAANGGGNATASSSPTAAVAAAPPANSAAPTVTGTARDGQTLTAGDGTWSGTPTITFSRQWQRCDSAGAGCAPIANATGATYALVPGDVGRTIRVQVTGANGGGSSSATSGQSAVVAAAPPVNTAAPTITGTARDGQTLSATDGTWTGTPTITFSRAWERCDSAGDGCVDVSSANTYALGPADVGSTIRVRVSATNGGGNSSATSSPTAVVASTGPANSAAPAISGTARDGQTLTAGDGTWTGTPTITFTRTWMRCDSSGNGCAAISGATGTTYSLLPADVGRTLRVEVTATNGAGSNSALSGQTAVVGANPPANSTPPTITGTARDGQTLTASNGIWSGTPTIGFARQWLRCDTGGGACAQIGQATGTTYVLAPADVGKTIRVEVTGTNGGGSSAATSAQTATV
ncbi:MAG: large repetitive protein, partial [Thermoleophilaceae bacterium]|nr:large repetitive protein [Thermoleophilaceae bacterium]